MKKNIVIVTLIAVILILGGSLLYLNMNKDKIGCTNTCKDNIENEKNNETSQNKQMTEEIKDCKQIVKNSVYIANDNSAMTFKENIVSQESGTAAWEDSYLIDGQVITFENSGIKNYAIISQDCNEIYTIDKELDSAVRIYKRK